MDTFDYQKQIVDAICEGKEPQIKCGSFWKNEENENYDDRFDDRRKERLENMA